MNGEIENPSDQQQLFRKRIRERLSFDPDIIVFEHQTNTLLGKLYDISDMGIRITSETPISPNRFIKIRLGLPYPVQEKDFIYFDTISLWNQYNSSSREYSTGFRMLNISNENHQLLQDMIQTYPPKNQIETYSQSSGM